MTLVKLLKWAIIGIITVLGFLLIVTGVTAIGGLLWAIFGSIGWIAGSFIGVIIKAFIYGGLTVIIVVLIGAIVKAI